MHKCLFFLLPDEGFQMVALHSDFSFCVSWTHSLSFKEPHTSQHNQFKVLSNPSQPDPSVPPSYNQGVATADSTLSRRAQHFPIQSPPLLLLLLILHQGYPFFQSFAALEVISNPITFIKPSLIPTHSHFPTSQIGSYVFYASTTFIKSISLYNI